MVSGRPLQCQQDISRTKGKHTRAACQTTCLLKIAVRNCFRSPWHSEARRTQQRDLASRGASFLLPKWELLSKRLSESHTPAQILRWAAHVLLRSPRARSEQHFLPYYRCMRVFSKRGVQFLGANRMHAEYLSIIHCVN